MAGLPVWLVYDFFSGQKTLYGIYQKTNIFLGKRMMVIVLIIIVLTNWIWNIIKYINL